MEWAEARGYGRYLGSSIKGESAIDWSSKRERRRLLAEIVADADRLLEAVRQAQEALAEGSPERQGIVAAAELLGQLLLQDVERTGEGIDLKDGVSRDRMVSVHDPEMRHGHKSSRRRFDGHKAAIVVDTDSQLITAVEVLPGNAPDNLEALELVERSEANTGVPVEETLADAAYGDGDTRLAFADAGRTLIARVPRRPNRKHFPKDDFRIDLEAIDLEAIDLEAIDLEAIDLEAIDLEAIDLEAIDLEAIDLEAIDLEAIDLEAIDLEAIDLEAIDLEAIDLEAIDLEAIDLEAIDLEAIDLEAIDLEAIDLEAIDLEAIDLEAIDLEAIDLEAIDLEAIDLEAGTCTCPAGQVTWKLLPGGRGPVPRDGLTGSKPSSSMQQCVGPARCSLNAWPGRPGRDEQCNCTRRRPCCSRPAPCSRARPLPGTAGGGWWWSTVWPGWCSWESGRPRYFGRAKTRFQLYLAATVANLTLVAGKAGLTGDIGGAAIGDRAACADTGSAAAIFGAIRLGQIWLLALLTPALLPKALFSTKAFHPHF